MYEEYWGLKEKPFENTPDPKFLWLSTQHGEALARLTYAVKERKGAAMLTGVFGCGKTLLAQALLEKLDKDVYKIALIINPYLDHIELLRAIAVQLGAVDLPVKKTEILTDFLLETLNNILVGNLNDGKETVIIIDEMHIIKDKMIFEELRLLLNFQLKDRFLLTLLFLGQPELKKHIETNKQLLQRIAIKCHLGNLDKAETISYINYRLQIAGTKEPIFSSSALQAIYQKSGGIPRRINQLCDISLLLGFSKRSKKIDENLVAEATE